MKRVLSFVTLIALIGTQSTFAAVKINEIYFSPEDPKDDRQFFELISDTGGAESLNNLWLLEIEGDAPVGIQQDNRGQVINAIDLSNYSTGSNGLFLWRDSATVLDNSAAPGVQGPGASGLETQAFSPQILGYDQENQFGDDIFQNNVHTFLLVEDYTGVVPNISQEFGANGTDLDTNDDGIIDAPAWTSVLDGISATEVGDPGFQYASQVGGTDFAGGFGADIWHRLLAPGPNGEWAFFDSDSGDGEPAGFQGPFFANDGGDAAFQDGTEIVVNAASTFLYATPGAANLTAVPEPSTAALLCITVGSLAMVRRRK